MDQVKEQILTYDALGVLEGVTLDHYHEYP